jgi:putative transposase
MMIRFTGAQVQQDMILTRVCRYMASPLSDRQLEELLQERGVAVDHAPIQRRVLST